MLLLSFICLLPFLTTESQLSLVVGGGEHYQYIHAIANSYSRCHMVVKVSHGRTGRRSVDMNVLRSVYRIRRYDWVNNRPTEVLYVRCVLRVA